MRFKKRRQGAGAITVLAAIVGLPVVPATAATPTAATATAATATAATMGGRVKLLPPNRVIDTRYVPGIGAPTGPSLEVALPSNSLLTATITDALEPGSAVVHPCGQPVPTTPAVLRFAADETVVNTLTSGPSDCLAATVKVHFLIDLHGLASPAPYPAGLQYVALPIPVDISPATALIGETQIALPSVPADAEATVLGITAAAVNAPGVVIVHPCSSTRPDTPDVLAGPAPSGSVVVTALGTTGSTTQCVFAQSSTVLQVTVLGYLTSSGPDAASVPPTLRWDYKSVPPPGLEALSPSRVLDTREAIGTPFDRKVEPGHVQELDLASFVTIQTTAVVLNLTVTDPEASGFVTAYPCDRERPTASNLNYVKGQTVPNLVTVALSFDATVCVYSQSRTNLVADLAATYEFGGGDGAMAVPPARVLDTRSPIGVPAAGKLGAGQVLHLAVAGHGGVPPAGATAVTMNVTVTDPAGDGFATVYPCDATKRPTASNLNYVTAQTVANAVTVKLSAGGEVCIFSQSATNLVADVNAWFAPVAASGFEELTPFRALDTRLGPGSRPVRGALSASGVLMPGQASGIALRDSPYVVGLNVLPADARAAVLNVTVTNPRGSGFLTVYPCDAPRPTVSNLNFTAAQTVPNQVTVSLGGMVGNSTIDLCFYSQQMVDVVVDVAGYYTDQPEAGWVPDIA